MYKPAIILALLNLASCIERSHKNDYFNPFKAIDQHFTQAIPLGYHYLWPWQQLLKSALVFDVQDSFGEPKIIPDPKEFKVQINLGQFNRQAMTVKVKNGYVTVERKHTNIKGDMNLSKYFAHRFPLPPGVKEDEVTAEYTDSGYLLISAPKHEVPPPPPEREVPIVYNVHVVSTEKSEIKEEIVKPSSESPIEQMETEATTHIGKIRKKELKTTTKTAKDNEVTKGLDENGLDYALIEAEE